MRKVLATLALTGFLVGGAAVGAAQGAPLPDNCTKDRGTVTCFYGPGKNQAGVGTYDETQGNTTNKSPKPQDLDCTWNPPKSQGAPNSC
jgi:hypothetical protein